MILLDIGGMGSSDCRSKLAGAVMFPHGVERVTVDVDVREASVTIDPPNSTSPEMLIAVIEQSGFSATLRDEN